MNRILFEPSEIVDGRAVFGGMRAQHVVEVLKGAPGQILKTGVLDGCIGTSEIESVSGEPAQPGDDPELASLRVTVRCVHDQPALVPWADIILAPPRPRALRRLLPQLAQLGVRRIVLVGAEKVEKAFWGAQLLKPEVHRPLLVDGLMQAGTTAVPEISTERSFRRYVESGALDAAFPTRLRVVAHPYGDSAVELPCPPYAERPLFAIGPEGGWTPLEVELLVAHGFRRQSLGSRILRTDTAAVALLARFLPLV